MKDIGENSGDEQLCQLTVGCAQQPHTEISDNNYELEEDEDNVLLSRQTVTPWNISYKIVFEMILVGVRSAILNKDIFLAAWTCKTNVL